MVDAHYLNQVLQLVRQVQAEYTNSSFPDCQALSRRCTRLEQRLTQPEAGRSHSRLLWIDEVRAALSLALRAAARVKDCKAEPQPTGIRAILAKIRGYRPYAALEREFETIRSSSLLIHEWLAAYTAILHEGDADDDDNSLISLGDSSPHLLEQYVPCHKAARAIAKQAILKELNSDGDAVSLIFVRGQRGVGKSVLATSLVRDPDVTRHFASGTGWVQLGQDSSEEDACDEIAEMVDAVAGGAFLQSVRHQLSLAAVVSHAEGRLRDYSLLVVLDDVCGKWGREALKALTTILGPNSVVVVTSAEDMDVLINAVPSSTRAFHVEVSPFPPTSDESGLVFDSWLHNQPERKKEEKNRLATFKGMILRACHGLPLALAMAAGSVSKCDEAWERVAATLASGAAPVQDGAPAEAQEVAATSTVTLLLDELLDRGDVRFGRQMRALAALPVGQWVSLKTLANLWGVDDASVKASARRIVKLSFGEYRLSDSIEQSAVRLCWHVSNYCLGLISPDELASAHQTLLDRCAHRESDSMSSGSSTTDAWWEVTLRDQYLRRRLCWHMACAGAFDDLRALLCEYSWMTNRLSASSSYGLRLDIELYMMLAKAIEGDTSVEAFQEVQNSLMDLSLSGRGQTAGRANLAPILATRLKALEEKNAVSRAILKSVYRDASRPWLKALYKLQCKPSAELLMASRQRDMESQNEGEEEQADASKVAVEVEEQEERIGGGENYIMATICNSLGHAIAGEANGRICVWDVRSGEQLAVFDATYQGNRKAVLGSLACLGNDVVVSGHSSGTLRLWSISRGTQEHELRGHDEQDVITALATYGTSTVVSGTNSGAIIMWLNVFSDEGPRSVRIQHLGEQEDEITALCILPGGTRVVSGDYYGFATIWDATKPSDKRVSLNGHKDHVIKIVSLAGGRRIASTCSGGSVNVWDSTTGSRLWSLTLGFEFGCVEALAAFASYNYGLSRTQVNSRLGAKVGFPYFCSRGEFGGELVVVTSVGQNEIVASTEFDGDILDWAEVVHPANGVIYVVVAHGNGALTTLELVTAL